MNMTGIIVVVVIALLAICGYRKGGTKIILNSIAWVISGVIAYILGKMIAQKILDWAIPSLIKGVEQSLSQETGSLFNNLAEQFKTTNAGELSTKLIETYFAPAITLLVVYVLFMLLLTITKKLLFATKLTELINNIPLVGIVNKLIGAGLNVIIPIAVIYVLFGTSGVSLASIINTISQIDISPVTDTIKQVIQPTT